MLVLSVACQSPPEQTGPSEEIHIIIDPNNLPPFAKLSEIATSVRLIPLETNSSCLIGTTTKVFVGKNRILITAPGGDSQIFHFNYEGKFLNTIGRKGKGPGEYNIVRGFTTFEDSSIVYVNMRSNRKIIKYSFDGSFIKEINYGKGLFSAKVLDYNRIAFNSYENYEVKIVNTQSKDIFQYLKSDNKGKIKLKYFTGNKKTGFFYTAVGRDTIWQIEKDSMWPAITFDFGSGHFPTEEYLNSIRSPNGYPPGKLSIGGNTFYGTGYYHLSLLREDNQDEYNYCHVLINNKTKSSLHFDQGLLSDDILFCTSTDFRTVAYNGEWVSVVGAHELIKALPEIIENHDFTYSQILIEQINNMTIEDNPVLVLYTLK